MAKRAFRPATDYTEEMLAFLESGYKEMATKALTEAFNRRFGQARTESAIKGTCYRHGFKTGRNCLFLKGQEPWNTGTKGVRKANKTSFKKGNVPASALPLGHERIAKGGYIEVKVDEPHPTRRDSTRFKPKHVVVWERENGPVPEGHCIRFKDGDKRNFDPANLVCISQGVNGTLNRRRFNALPAEFQDTALTIAKIEEKIRQRITA